MITQTLILIVFLYIFFYGLKTDVFYEIYFSPSRNCRIVFLKCEQKLYILWLLPDCK